ncbi:MAG: hypothetical protein V1725_06670 [archaeon]
MQSLQGMTYAHPEEKKELYRQTLAALLDTQPFVASYPTSTDCQQHDVFGMPPDMHPPSHALLVSRKQLQDIITRKPNTAISFFGEMLHELCVKNQRLLNLVLDTDIVVASCSAYAKSQKNDPSAIDVLALIEGHYQPLAQTPVTKDVDWELSCALSSPTLDTMRLVLAGEEKIRAEPDALLRNLVGELQASYAPLFARFGDIRAYEPLLELNNTTPEPFTYALPGQTYVVVPHEGFFVVTLIETEQELSYPFLSTKEGKTIVDRMFDAGYLRVNIPFCEKNIHAVEKREIMHFSSTREKEILPEDKEYIARLKQKQPTSTFEHIRFIRKYLQKSLADNKDWTELRDVMYDGKKVRYFPLSLELLFVESIGHPAVNAIVESLHAYDPFLHQQNDPEGFIEAYKDSNWTERSNRAFYLRTMMRAGKHLAPEVHGFLKKEGRL